MLLWGNIRQAQTEGQLCKTPGQCPSHVPMSRTSRRLKGTWQLSALWYPGLDPGTEKGISGIKSKWTELEWCRAFPYSAAKNIINLISVLTTWWCPCVDSSLVCWKQMFAMTIVFSWYNSVSLCSASFLLQGQTFLYLQIFLDFLLLHFSPLWWNGHLFWC